MRFHDRTRDRESHACTLRLRTHEGLDTGSIPSDHLAEAVAHGDFTMQHPAVFPVRPPHARFALERLTTGEAGLPPFRQRRHIVWMDHAPPISSPRDPRMAVPQSRACAGCRNPGNRRDDSQKSAREENRRVCAGSQGRSWVQESSCWHLRRPAAHSDREGEGRCSSASVSSVNRNVAPGPGLAIAHNWPPCDSTIERAMASPMPVPCGFVVMKDSKI